MQILTIVGARPQFIKAAAVSRAIEKREDIAEKIVHTGQHFDRSMSEIFFQELGIPEPYLNLNIHGGPHGQMTGEMLAGLETAMLAETPDLVIVYGDTNSTLAGALAASKLHIPVVHVEAGLRSFNRRMPEEINRVVTDHLSSTLFCPTLESVENLENEGITDDVHHVGDVMYDAAIHAFERGKQRSNILQKLGLKDGSYVLATVHRADNTESKSNLERVFNYIREHAGEMPIVLPLHPRTSEAAKRFDVSLEGLNIIEPVGYLDMAYLTAKSHSVITDSGGLQKEAYFHRVPCVTLRDETEWTETVKNGWNRLWNCPDYAEPRKEIDDYGVGSAAEKIVDLICG